MCSIKNYVDFENAMILVTKYNNQLLLPLLIETYNLLMPNLVEEPIQSTHNLDNCDLFRTIDTLKVFVVRQLHGFHCYFVDVNNYKCTLAWWHKERV